MRDRQPIILRLQLDTMNGTYQIFSKSLSDSNFQNHGAGKTASSHPAKFLRVSIVGNFTDQGEVAKIDSLQVNWKPDENQSH